MSSSWYSNLTSTFTSGVVSPLPDLNSQLSPQEVETHLRGQNPYTYILTPTSEAHQFCITFVDRDMSIQRRFFTQIDSVYTFKNGDLHRHNNQDELIRDIMHCTEQFRPFRLAKK